MEAEVYSQPSVAAGIALNYVPVKINADYFPATAKQYGVTALPTTVVTSPQGQLLDTIVGRAETADYVARLNQIAAAAKPHSAPVYAQVPASAPATPPPAAVNPPVAAWRPVVLPIPLDPAQRPQPRPLLSQHPTYRGQQSRKPWPRTRNTTPRRPSCFQLARPGAGSADRPDNSALAADGSRARRLSDNRSARR